MGTRSYHIHLLILTFAIIAPLASSCGTIMEAGISSTDTGNIINRTDTVTIVKEQLLKIFLKRYLPQYNIEKDPNSDIKNKYGISVKDAVAHYSRTDIKTNKYKTQNPRTLKAHNEIPSLPTAIKTDDSCSLCIISSPKNMIMNGDSIGLASKDNGLHTEENTLQYRFTFDKGSYEFDVMNDKNIIELNKLIDFTSKACTDKSLRLDSLYITVSASPEGTYWNNYQLSKKRNETILTILNKLIKYKETRQVKIYSYIISEDWDTLGRLVAEDGSLSINEKNDFIELYKIESPDKREEILSSRPYYRHIADSIYPKLRIANVSLYFHAEHHE